MTDEIKKLLDNKKEAVPISELPKEKVPKTPDNIRFLGVFKLKDRQGRDVMSFKVDKDVEGVIIQKIKGTNNKIAVALKMFNKKDEKPNT